MLLRSVKSSGDSEIDNGVYVATLKEREKGFLRGPIHADAVPSGGTLTRRFGVQQKGKVRPIDDYKASMVNSAVTQVAGVCSSFQRALHQHGRSVVYNPGSGLPEIFQQAVLPFGSVASVTAFLRCALEIWHIGSRLLKPMWTSYFDDFLSITTKNLTRHT